MVIAMGEDLPGGSEIRPTRGQRVAINIRFPNSNGAVSVSSYCSGENLPQ